MDLKNGNYTGLNFSEIGVKISQNVQRLTSVIVCCAMFNRSLRPMDRTCSRSDMSVHGLCSEVFASKIRAILWAAFRKIFPVYCHEFEYCFLLLVVQHADPCPTSTVEIATSRRAIFKIFKTRQFCWSIDNQATISLLF